jgi:uncharacterized protein
MRYTQRMSSPCDDSLHPFARLGLVRFNAEQYWLAHEALEDAWNAEEGIVRDLYRGILQAAVVYHHLRRKNLRGAIKVYERSQKWLGKWDSPCRGVNVAKLRDDLDAAIAEAKALGVENIADFKGYTKIDYE